MTILTDEEKQALLKEWDSNVLLDLIEDVEAAVLEKLKQQEPVCYGVNKHDEGVWYIHQSKATCQGYAEHYGHRDAKGCDQCVVPLYAAPMPDDSLQLYKNLADEYGLSVFDDIAELKKQHDDLLTELLRVKEICLRELGNGVVNEVVIASVKEKK